MEGPLRGCLAGAAAWKTIPSWFVWGELDKLIPAGVTNQRNEEAFLVLGKGQRLLLAGNERWNTRL